MEDSRKPVAQPPYYDGLGTTDGEPLAVRGEVETVDGSALVLERVSNTPLGDNPYLEK